MEQPKTKNETGEALRTPFESEGGNSDLLRAVLEQLRELRDAVGKGNELG